MTKYKVHCVLIAILLLNFGCASTKVVEHAAAAPSAQVEPPAAAPAVPPANFGKVPPSGEKSGSEVEELTLPEFKRPAASKPLPKTEPMDAKQLVHAEGPAIINVENMPIPDFIIYALGQTLKVTFFIDEQVKNMKDPVTLMMTKEMPADKVFDIVVGFLEKQGLNVDQKAGALYITGPKPQQAKPFEIEVGEDVPDTSANILQVVPLKYVRTGDIESLIRDMYRTGVNIKSYPKENALLLSGPAPAIKEIVDFVRMFDVPYLQGRKAFVLKLTYWYTAEFMKQISEILDGLGFTVARSSREPGILFIPIKFLNSILVLTPDEESAKYVLDWHRRLDTPESAGTEEKAYTFSPKYSKASDLVDAVIKLYGGGKQAAQPKKAGEEKGRVASAETSAVGGMNISADDKRNLILIRSTPAQYEALLRYLEKLDLPPRQVLIEATIAELTLKGDLAYGLEWYIKNRMYSGDYTLQTLGQLGLSTTQGLTYQFLSDSQKVQVAMNAFAQENRINIISKPRLMVLDNEEATIEVGTEVPVVTGEISTSTSTVENPNILRNIQYRNTGTILKIRPTINTGGLLTLNLSQEVSEAQTNTTSTIDSPLILTRRITTTVVSTNGQSIVLGGIMSDNKSTTVTKVPLLGDIPILGNLFKTTSDSDTKTELIVLITPKILSNSEEATKVTNEMKQELKWSQ